MSWIDKALDRMGATMARRLACTPDPDKAILHTDTERLLRVMRPGDVLLVDGCDRVSATIRYLTQSRWSHAAIFVGPAVGEAGHEKERHTLVEVNLGEGCISAPVSKYATYPTRICRPVNLTDADRDAVVAFVIDRIGLKYDLRNVVDLARFLVPQPPLPARWRRRMIALGAGEPTRAICSTLIAQAFQSVRYPILPRLEPEAGGRAGANGYSARDVFHIRHHSLFTPSDFDLSPYFEIIKPTLAEGFNYKGLQWADDPGRPAGDPPSRAASSNTVRLWDAS